MLTSRFPQDSSNRPAVPDLVRLTPSCADRRLYAVKSIGTLRITGLTRRAATAEAGGRSWQLSHRGICRSTIRAADAAGDIVGEFRGRRVHHSATLLWSGRPLGLRLDGLRQNRYALVNGDRKLATISATGSTERGLNITIHDADIDPGPLLFAIYIVQLRTQRRTPWP